MIFQLSLHEESFSTVNEYKKGKILIINTIAQRIIA